MCATLLSLHKLFNAKFEGAKVSVFNSKYFYILIQIKSSNQKKLFFYFTETNNSTVRNFRMLDGRQRRVLEDQGSQNLSNPSQGSHVLDVQAKVAQVQEVLV